GGLLPVHVEVAMRLAPFGDPFQGPPQALLHRLDMNREVPSPATRALVGKAEEVERVGFRPRPACAREGFAPKRHETRLFRVEGQPTRSTPALASFRRLRNAAYSACGVRR